MRIAAALPILLLCVGCSSPTPVATPVPTPSDAPASDRLAVVSSTDAPILDDRNCGDFPSQHDAQGFYIEAGGPDQDLHGLDPDRNGNACDDRSPPPSSSAAVATAPPSAIPTAAPPVGTPNELRSSSGSVDGKSGGSDNNSSCESSDETRCR